MVRALGTDLGSLKIALESVEEFCGTCVPCEVVGQSELTSVRGSVCATPLSSVSFSTCR